MKNFDPEVMKLIEEYELDPIDVSEESPRVLALAVHYGCDPFDITASSWNPDQNFEIGSKSFLVVTCIEADDLWDEYLDSYIDDCLEIPEHLESYFNAEAWKNDAKMDGRGHSLAHYDSNEYAVDIGDATYYIYRQN